METKEWGDGSAFHHSKPANRTEFSNSLTLCFHSRYIALMATRLTIPRKYSRERIESRMDELSLQFQRTPHVKIIRKISALNRLLARMDGRVQFPEKFH